MNHTEDSKWDELREKARKIHEKGVQATFAKKRKEGYKFWCHVPGDYSNHRIYFRNLKSAEGWLRKNKSKGEIYPL
jgi:hypothetical protein